MIKDEGRESSLVPFHRTLIFFDTVIPRSSYVRHCSARITHLIPLHHSHDAWSLIVGRVWLCIALLSTLQLVDDAQAQDVFGSLDDPSEQTRSARWDAFTEFTGATGFSLIGPQWRGVGRFDVTSRGSHHAFRMESSFRSGVYGTYDPESDEWRDVLRTLDHLRYQPLGKGRYVRLGTLNRTRFGSGHLVNFFSTEASWDDRSVGAEVRLHGQHQTLEAFTSDITRRATTGARLALSPFYHGRPGITSLQVAAAVIQDERARTDTGNPFKAFEGEVRMTAYRNGSFDFVPFASVAWLPDYGQGLLVGANLENANFIDLARLHLSLALHYNSSDFRPALFGAFYEVSGPGRGIAADGKDVRADLPLREIKRGNSILFESRILFFERLEFWYAFQRYHGTQRMSEYHLRLQFHARDVRISIAQDRRGLKGFTSLFGDLGAENRMRFQFDLRLLRQVWVLMDAHYTYRVAASTSGQTLYSIQRRFDPVIGLRARF